MFQAVWNVPEGLSASPVPVKKIFAGVQVCLWDGHPWREHCARGQGKHFSNFPEEKSMEWQSVCKARCKSRINAYGLGTFLVLRHPRVCLLLRIAHWSSRVKRKEIHISEDPMSLPLTDIDWFFISKEFFKLSSLTWICSESSKVKFIFTIRKKRFKLLPERVEKG